MGFVAKAFIVCKYKVICVEAKTCIMNKHLKS
jgi:hypothetical protein